MDNDKIFSIPSWNVDRLEREIAKLNRRADKIGCPRIDLVKVGEVSRLAPGYEERAEIWGESECPHITLHQFRLEGEGPLIAGYKFIGTLDHNTLPGSVIVNAVPGETVPQHFHNAGAECGHCGKIRRRNETFVLENEDGGFIQVGRQCIKDFLGHNPTGVAAFLSRIIRFADEVGDPDGDYWGIGGGSVQYTFAHDTVLKVTAAIINKYGWTPRSAAGEGRSATADEVLSYFFPPKGDSRAYAQWKEWVEALDVNRESFAEDAKNARIWLREQDSDNEYMHNLHTIDQAEEVPTRLFGYWCSLLSTYQRAMERLELAKAEKKVNEHVGKVKERLTTVVKVVSIKITEGYYGTVRIVRMLDEGGRTLIWFANGEVHMDQGNKYKIAATVTKHDEYRDWKQTKVNRVKVLEEINE